VGEAAMTTICLSMIVKDEAHTIARCLNSVKDHISYWVICDTGSKDNTEEVVRETLKDIPGEFHKHEWKDFSTNRNYALDAAKGKCDYKLIIDADDYLEISDKNCFNNLTAPVYDVMLKHANVCYSRPQLVRDNIVCKYRGVLHEYLELPTGITNKPLTGCFIRFGGTGARSRDPQKFVKDCIVFEEAIKTDPSARNVFYYAQSLRDGGFQQQALWQYKKRFDMGGWVEERFISMLNVARIYETINPDDENTVEEMYLLAYKTLPERSESLYSLALYFRNRKNFIKGYCYACLGMRIEQPEGLFIESDVYRYKLMDEAAVDAYWIGKMGEAKELNEKLLKIVPDHEKIRINQNLIFCN
jgi:glycosyltransferase involved in cell wall biosynthesis